MRALDQLRTLEKSQEVPDHVLTKPPKPGSVSFVSAERGTFQNFVPIARDDRARFRWSVTRPDGHAIEVRYLPEATRAKVEADYPGAKVEPITDPARTAATPAQARELRELVASILADDTEADRAEALAIALADPDVALTCYRMLAEQACKIEMATL